MRLLPAEPLQAPVSGLCPARLRFVSSLPYKIRRVPTDSGPVLINLEHAQTMFTVKTTTTLSTLACTVWFSVAAHAAPPGLSAVVQAGFEHYPQRALSDAIHRQGQAVRQQAASLLADDPAIRLRHENDAWTDSDGFRSWEGGLDLPLWLPGQRDRRNEVANATDREAEAVRQLQYWQVAGEIRELLWSLRIAETGLALARQAADSGTVLENDVNKRFQAGELARTDLILAQKEALARQGDLIAAESTRERLIQQYQAWTGLSELPTDIEEQIAPAKTLTDTHPALAAARLGTSRARAKRDQIQGEKRANPVLTLGGKSERPVSGASYDTAMTLELHLPLGTKSQAAVRTADAERSLTEASAELARVMRELDTNLQRARVERETAGRSLQLAQRQQALAVEGLRLTQRAFELGESDLFTLLQARAQALTAERDVRLRHLELGRATARYNQALGALPE